MLKKSCLALALCALGATASHAAIMSINYASTLDGLNVTGTFSWDTASVGNVGGGGNLAGFQATGASLFIDNVNYSGNLSNPTINQVRFQSGRQIFAMSFGLSGIAALPAGSSFLSIRLEDNQAGIFSDVASLPSSFSAFDGLDLREITISDDSGGALQGSVTISSSVPSPIPEPGSLMLAAVGSLALFAARRRLAAA